MRNTTNNGRAHLGIIFIVVGIAFILKILDFLPDGLSDVLFSWQMLLIAIGAFNFVNKKYTPAIILISIGVLFIIPEIFSIDYTYRRLFWPFVLVIAGVVMIGRRNKGFELAEFNDVNNSSEYIDHASIFGGNKVIYSSKSFRGGRITSIFGGSEVNFQNAEIAGETAIIDVFTMFGGTKLLVPQGWNVQIEVVSIFGGFNDKRFLGSYSNNSGKTLIIKGFAIFGGGDIRN
ncbi:MAG: hypothetical protein KAH10_03670 [Flavobacteriales bacterium]|nr:hypothetical protein [Flavobacteriales bacterium]